MEFLNKHKRLFLAFGIVICLSAIVVTVTGVAPTSFLGRAFGYVVVPLQRGASSATGWISGRIDVLMRSEQILEENRALREENIRLMNENERMQNYRDENLRMHEAMRMTQRYTELSMIGTRLIGQNPNDWQSRFIIDIGTNSGIAEYMAVMGIGGLLGRIRSTGANFSLVETIMDNNFRAAARNVRTEDVGVVVGDLELAQDGLMRMNYIVAAARFMPGDEIRTSAQSVLPPGLLIGTVVSIHPNPDGHTQHAIIQPAVDLGRIDFVLVIDQLFNETPIGIFDDN